MEQPITTVTPPNSADQLPTATTISRPATDFDQAISGLDPAYRDHVQKNGYGDIASIIKSDMETRAMIGADKATLMKIPKSARADDPSAWAGFDQALGVPQDGKYPEFKPAEGSFNATEEQLLYFDAAAHKAGMPPAYRNAALEAFHSLNQEAITAGNDSMAQEKAQGAAQLQKDMGMTYPIKLQEAVTALDGLDGGDSFTELMERHNLHDHPEVQRMLISISGMRAEGEAPQNGSSAPDNAGNMTPQQAQAKRSALEGDVAFMKRYTSGDQSAINEMLKLNTAIHPTT